MLFPYRKEMLECAKSKDEKLYAKLMNKLKFAKYTQLVASCIFSILICGEVFSRVLFEQKQASTIIFICFAVAASMSFASAHYLDLLSRILEFEFNKD